MISTILPTTLTTAALYKARLEITCAQSPNSFAHPTSVANSKGLVHSPKDAEAALAHAEKSLVKADIPLDFLAEAAARAMGKLRRPFTDEWLTLEEIWRTPPDEPDLSGLTAAHLKGAALRWGAVAGTWGRDAGAILLRSLDCFETVEVAMALAMLVLKNHNRGVHDLSEIIASTRAEADTGLPPAPAMIEIRGPRARRAKLVAIEELPEHVRTALYTPSWMYEPVPDEVDWEVPDEDEIEVDEREAAEEAPGPIERQTASHPNTLDEIPF